MARGRKRLSSLTAEPNSRRALLGTPSACQILAPRPQKRIEGKTQGRELLHLVRFESAFLEVLPLRDHPPAKVHAIVRRV